MEETWKELMEAVKGELGAGYEVQFEEVTKNNGMVLHAAMIRKTGENVCPTIYIDSLLKKVNADAIGVHVAAQEIVNEYRECHDMKQGIEFMVTGFTRQSILSRVIYQLVNAEKNAEMLAYTPHRKFLDLAAICRVPVDEDGSGTVSFVLSRKMCRAYGISEAELHAAAKSNTRKKGFSVSPIGSVLKEIAGMEEEDFTDVCQTYVLTSAGRLYGASVMLRSDCFDSLADKLKDDLYILPSSIHEVIAVPAGWMNKNDLMDMVREVNECEVSEEEFLSGNVYRYSRAERRIEIV